MDTLILLLQTGRLSSGGRQSAQGHIGTSCEAKTRVQAGLTLAQAFTPAPRAQDVFESGLQPGRLTEKNRCDKTTGGQMLKMTWSAAERTERCSYSVPPGVGGTPQTEKSLFRDKTQTKAGPRKSLEKVKFDPTFRISFCPFLAISHFRMAGTYVPFLYTALPGKCGNHTV